MVQRRILAAALTISLLGAGASAAVSAQHDGTPSPGQASPSAGTQTVDGLVALLPVELLGLPVQTNSLRADTLLASSASDAVELEITTVAERYRADIDELDVAVAGTQEGAVFAAVLAATIPGVPADALADPLTRLLFAEAARSRITEISILERDVLEYEYSNSAGQASRLYVLPSDEVLWFIVADVEALESIVASLR